MIARTIITLTLGLLLIAAVWPEQAAAVEADNSEAEIIVSDAHFGEVLFYFYQEDYFPAIVRLLAAKQQKQFVNHSEEAELLLGGLYLSYGHHLRAAEIFEELLADNVKPEVRDRTWFFLAKIWQQRGYLSESEKALANIKGVLPSSMEAERQMLKAQLHIENGEHDEAIALLGSWTDKTEWSSYARFNLGVAMVRSGRVNSAAQILDDLGRLDPFNEELSSLRDKANLALGYAYLQDGQPLAAKPPLQRVRLNGPFSNKALLGVGWADAENDDFHRALVPWMELRNRDLLDSAVQESMLAVPYAMAKLDSISQAADHYLNAIEAFYEESSRIDNTIDLIESGVLFEEFLAEGERGSTGWFWRLESLPERVESRYLMHLLSTHEFQEGLKNYRDLNYLTQNLEEWQGKIGVFRNMLDTRELAYEKRLPIVNDSLGAADIDAMVQRKLEFDAHVSSIEESSDALALATPGEFELWGEIVSLERNSALQADIPEAAEVRAKVRLLKGVLQWNLEKEFRPRLARLRRDLRQTGEALVKTQRSRRKIDEAMREEPVLFAAFNQRVDGLGPKIDVIKTRVDRALGAQLAYLQTIAVEELQAQKQRLDTYTVQARFALAAIYDLSSILGNASR